MLRQEILHLQRLVRRDAERIEVELQPAGLRVSRVQAHDRDDDIGEVRRGLAVAEEHRVVDRMEPECVVTLQGRMIPTGLIHPRDQGSQTV
jgi:hypothetical protein